MPQKIPRGLSKNNKGADLSTAHFLINNAVVDTIGDWKEGKFLVGRSPYLHQAKDQDTPPMIEERYVGYQDDRHIVTVAGSRSGKGINFVVPNIFLWKGSVLAIDPKGELSMLCAEIPCYAW